MKDSSPSFVNRSLTAAFLLAMLFTAGCGTLQRVQHVPNWKTASEREVDPLPIPNQYGPFSTWQKLNPRFWIGNADDPEPPDWYRPDEPGRRWKWHIRNPFHNLTFYIIGIADKDFTRLGAYPESVFNPGDGWNWTVSHAKLLPLPFVSYKRNSFQFYFGWRERGNFGIKFRGLRFRAKPQKNVD